MTHQQLLELHVARKALEDLLKDAKALSPGSYELSDVRVAISVREACVRRDADGEAAPTSKINWLLMCAFLLGELGDPAAEKAKKRLMVFAEKTLADGQPGPVEALAADLEQEFEAIKIEVRKKLDPVPRKGATVVKALGVEVRGQRSEVGKAA